MDAEIRDNLINLGYELLKENDKKTVWVFVNNQELNFDTLNIPCVISDTLTF